MTIQETTPLMSHHSRGADCCVAFTTAAGATIFGLGGSAASVVTCAKLMAPDWTTQKIIELALYTGLGFGGAAIFGGVLTYTVSKLLINGCRRLSQEQIYSTADLVSSIHIHRHDICNPDHHHQVCECDCNFSDCDLDCEFG